MSDRVELARRSYEAYATSDQASLDELIAADFEFWSPYDGGLDRATYFERCWPNHETTQFFDFVRVAESGDEVMVTYELTKTDGHRFRNTEILGSRAGSSLRPGPTSAGISDRQADHVLRGGGWLSALGVSPPRWKRARRPRHGPPRQFTCRRRRPWHFVRPPTPSALVIPTFVSSLALLHRVVRSNVRLGALVTPRAGRAWSLTTLFPTGGIHTLSAVSAGLTSIEVCAGAGGQALGLEQAGFGHLACVELDSDACDTLKLNRPNWHVIQADLNEVVSQGDLAPHRKQCDLLAGGVPCPPFSIAGRQLGADDERDLFPAIISLVGQLRPRALLIENVRGILSSKFTAYRAAVEEELAWREYVVSDWGLVEACRYGVPQLRPRALLVAFRSDVAPATWRLPSGPRGVATVGDALYQLMAAEGWSGAAAWAQAAQTIAPTLVGGSKKHGGPDLGPTRAKREWLKLNVDAKGLANSAPSKDHPEDHIPRLTVEMCAAVQGFPSDWRFAGAKTSRYRQVGNAFPPPVAKAVATSVREVLLRHDALVQRAA